jgi:hypothetical protein
VGRFSGGLVLLIGDDPHELQQVAEFVVSLWPDAATRVVAGEGSRLLTGAREAIRASGAADCSGPSLGTVVLDLNWGAQASLMGCELVRCLRQDGCRVPVVVRSSYEREDGSLREPAASNLPPELGWLPWRNGDVLRQGRPAPLTDDELRRARLAAGRIAVRACVRTLDAIWHEIRPAFYRQPVDPGRVRGLLDDLASVSGPAVAVAGDAGGAVFAAIAEACASPDVTRLRTALAAYEDAARSMLTEEPVPGAAGGGRS